MADRKTLRARFEELKNCWERRVFGTISEEEVDAVLELIREAEPHVLTLAKIQSGTVEVAWLECSDKEEVRAGLWFKRINEGEDEGIIIHVLDGFEGLRTAVYGKTWRCWTARPTEEQMRDTPWEGEGIK